MEIINTEQNTDSWLEGRKKIIGASEVPIIMGVSPHSTPRKLWAYKVGHPSCVNKENQDWIFRRGHEKEDIARSKFEFKLGIELPPAVVKNSDLEFCQSSLDGFNLKEKKQVEIKLLGKEYWNDLKNNQTVPEHYMPQLQYQLITTGFEKTFFLGINDDNEIAYTSVYPNKKMIEDIINATTKFFYIYMAKREMPPLHKDDYDNVSDKEMQKSLDELNSISIQMKSLKAKKEDLRKFVEENMTHNRIQHNGTKASKTQKSLRITFK